MEKDAKDVSEKDLKGMFLPFFMKQHEIFYSLINHFVVTAIEFL